MPNTYGNALTGEAPHRDPDVRPEFKALIDKVLTEKAAIVPDVDKGGFFVYLAPHYKTGDNVAVDRILAHAEAQIDPDLALRKAIFSGVWE